MSFQAATFVVLMICVVAVYSQEPQCVCSKFHYEEQLLEKTIRTEIKFEALQKKVEDILQEATEKYDKLTSVMEKWKEDSDRSNAESLASIAEEKTKISDTLVQINTLAERAMIPDVLFKAKKPSDLTPGISRLVFTETMYSIGGGYDNQTGIFTAPVEGLYLFTGQLCNYVRKHVFYAFVVDGKDVTRGRSYDQDTYNCFSFDALVKLELSSTVYVQSYYASTQMHTGTDHFNTFSGVLLH